MSAAIVVQGLSKQFGSKIALDKVSLEIPAGVVFAILGENGAGKSTLIRSLMGYYQTNQGSVRILGLDPARQHVEIRRRVGYVSDMPALYDWMKVAQIAWFTSGFYPEGYAERFAKWGDDFKLPLNVRIRSLSKGMKAKVALALTLAADPEVLILDEPTSGLDPVVRRDFMEAMVDLASRGKTVLLSSHQVHEVERVADYIAILSDGTLKVCDRLETLKESVRLVTFTLRDPLAIPPDAILDLTPLRQTIRMRQVQYVLRDVSESEALAEKLRGNLDVTDLQIVRPSLEDLYMAFTQSSEKLPWEEGSASNSKHSVA